MPSKLRTNSLDNLTPTQGLHYSPLSPKFLLLILTFPLKSNRTASLSPPPSHFHMAGKVILSNHISLLSSKPSNGFLIHSVKGQVLLISSVPMRPCFQAYILPCSMSYSSPHPLHSNQTVLQFLEHINHFTCLEPCICCSSNMNADHPDTCRGESSPSSDFCCNSSQGGSQILQTTANSHCQSLFPSPQPSSPYHHLTHYKFYLLDYCLLSIP